MQQLSHFGFVKARDEYFDWLADTCYYSQRAVYAGCFFSPLMLLQPGTAAPAFELASAPDKMLSLHELQGKRVILVFYPADWSPVCGDEIALYNQTRRLFEPYNAQVVGISVDSKWCHQAFAESRHLHFPLLADFEPKGAVSRAYGAYDEARGVSLRALFVLDEAGIIRWSYLSPDDVNPGADGILDALDALAQPQPH